MGNMYPVAEFDVAELSLVLGALREAGNRVDPLPISQKLTPIQVLGQILLHLVKVWYAQKALCDLCVPIVIVRANDHAAIVYAGGRSLPSLRRIKFCNGAIRVAHKTVLRSFCVRVGTRD
jgi:hypothetical protein